MLCSSRSGFRTGERKGARNRYSPQNLRPCIHLGAPSHPTKRGQDHQQQLQQQTPKVFHLHLLPLTGSLLASAPRRSFSLSNSNIASCGVEKNCPLSPVRKSSQVGLIGCWNYILAVPFQRGRIATTLPRVLLSGFEYFGKHWGRPNRQSKFLIISYSFSQRLGRFKDFS